MSFKINKRNEDKIIKFLSKTKAQKDSSRGKIPINLSVNQIQRSLMKSQMKSNNEKVKEESKYKSSISSIRPATKKITSERKLKTREESPKTILKNLINNTITKVNKHNTINYSKANGEVMIKGENSRKKNNSGSIPIENKVKTISELIETIEFPISVEKSFFKLRGILAKEEQEEIKYYEKIYYLNLNEKAIITKFK